MTANLPHVAQDTLSSDRKKLAVALRHLPTFIGYVLRQFPLARLVFLLSLLILVLEYAALSLMIPFSYERPAIEQGGSVVHFWTGVAAMVGVPATQTTWLWLFFLLLACRLATGYLHVLLTSWVAKQVHTHLSRKTFHRVLLEEPMTEIYRRSIGYYVTLSGDDTHRAGTIIVVTSQTVVALTSALAGFLLLYLFSPLILVWTVAYLVACGVFIALAFRHLLLKNIQSITLSRELNTAFIEAFNSLRSIRSMACEKFILEGYAAQIRAYVRLLFQIDATRNGMKFLPGFCALVAGMVVLWPGTERADGVTASYFFAATTVLMRIFMSLNALLNSLSVLLMDIRAASDITELLKAGGEPERDDHRVEGVPIKSIQISRITYGYREGERVLDNVDFEFEAGKTYAIVGRSGSGKSTLADILLGLVPQGSGEIEVNRDANPASQTMRQRVVLVEQQAKIFSVSVRENLLLGLAIEDSVLWAALSYVDLKEHVRSLAHGLDTILEYQGTNLSGGQRQRLAIARALIRNPSVLILDEATSALDLSTRQKVVKNLREYMKAGILIFITHETNIVDAVDVVLKLDKPQSESE